MAHAFTSRALADRGGEDVLDELRVMIIDEGKTTAYFTFSSRMRPVLHQLRVFGSRNGLALDETHAYWPNAAADQSDRLKRTATIVRCAKTGCAAPDPGTGTSPAAGTIKAKIYTSVYGIGPGTFTVSDPALGTSGTAQYYDLSVTYTQPTTLLMFPGPTMTLSRNKRVWISGNGTPS